MMRLPLFEFRAPRTLEEAARILDGERANAMPLAGGTDLLPNMKRRQQVPRTLMSLRYIEDLTRIQFDPSASRLGACLTLSDIAADPRFRNGLAALAQAASQVATPHIRNMATLGGNLCLDTRCNYYDQSYEWRKAIDFCLKKDGTTCWVAPGSPTCMAVSSTDTAPALIALGARVRLVSRSEEREVPLSALYNHDGMNYIRRRPDEILAEVLLDSLHGWKSTYWKLRRRGSFDFPVLGVAAALGIVSCGGGNNLLPGATAQQIQQNLDTVSQLAASGNCSQAFAEAQTVSQQIQSLVTTGVGTPTVDLYLNTKDPLERQASNA